MKRTRHLFPISFSFMIYPKLHDYTHIKDKTFLPLNFSPLDDVGWVSLCLATALLYMRWPGSHPLTESPITAQILKTRDIDVGRNVFNMTLQRYIRYQKITNRNKETHKRCLHGAKRSRASADGKMFSCVLWWAEQIWDLPTLTCRLSFVFSLPH